MPQLRRVARIVNGGTPTANLENWGGDVAWVTPEDLGSLEGDKIRSTKRTLTRKGLTSCSATLVPPGSVILSTRAPVGYAAQAEIPIATNQGCRAAVPTANTNSRFLFYQMVAKRPELQARANGSTFQELSAANLASLELELPSAAAQIAIADFLDRETGRIDRLVEKKRRLIELLEEKRTALISHAVTKGLDPTVPMKDSGIPWLGEIPAHWDALPIRRVAHYTNSNVDKKSLDGEIPVLLCNYTDVYYGSYLDSTEGFMEATATPEEIRRFRLVGGTVLITKDSETADDIGIPAFVSRELDAVCGYHLTVLTPYRRRLRGDFLYWALESAPLRAAFETAAKGVTRYGLTLDGIGSTIVPVPPLAEQATLAEMLRTHDLRSAKTADRIELQLEKLAEYRQALITAAVTGQIDVTAEAPEPEEVVA